MRVWIAPASALVFALFATSCGDSKPAVSLSECQGSATYPKTGCGTNEGQAIANLTFEGRPSGIESPFGSISFAQYHEPEGKTTRYLVADSSAMWCGFCKFLAATHPDWASQFEPRGVKFLTVLSQNTKGGAVQPGDVDLWIKTYRLETAVAMDPQNIMQPYLDGKHVPVVMIIDTTTMKIVKKYYAESFSELSTDLDALLKAAGR